MRKMRQIPKNIHIAWTGPSPMEFGQVQAIEKMRNTIEGYQIHIWNENTYKDLLPSFGASFDRFILAAKKTKNWRAFNEFVKVLALVKYGGWAISCSDEFIKAPNPFSRIPFVSGFCRSGGSLYPITTVWGAMPQHKFSRLMLSAYNHHSPETILSSENIEWLRNFLISAGATCNDSRQYIDELDIHLFPASVFSSTHSDEGSFVVSSDPRRLN